MSCKYYLVLLNINIIFIVQISYRKVMRKIYNSDDTDRLSAEPGSRDQPIQNNNPGNKKKPANHVESKTFIIPKFLVFNRFEFH